MFRPIRTAALMIERYAKVSPEETDDVLAALAAAKSTQKEHQL
ncbi:MAG: hypothetical protein ABJC93_19030 [Roseobacter sp.]